jgi:hypothetical protein
MVATVMHLTENTVLMTSCEVHEVTGCKKLKKCDRKRGKEAAYLCHGNEENIKTLIIHKETNKCMYVNCIHRMFFITDMFQPLSRSSPG